MAKRICSSSKERERWLEERRKGIGSSDAPAILGISPFASPATVAASKRGLDREDAESELMRWGHYVEGPMIEALRDETKMPAQLDGSMYRSEERGLEFMHATPDGTVVADGERGGIECKLKVFGADEWEESGIPPHVVAQCQHSMRVLELRFFIVVALLDGYRLRWKRIERDDAFINERLIPAERDFWSLIETGRAAPLHVGNPKATGRILASMHPRDDGSIVQLDADAEGHAARWEEAQEMERHWKTIKEQHRHALAGAIGNSTYGKLPDGTVLSLKTTDRSGYQVNPTTFRTLRREKKR